MDGENTVATMEERIRAIMETQGMNQQTFSERTGISPASLSNIFNKRTRATNNHTIALHRAFPNLNVNWLLFGEGEMFDAAPVLQTPPSPPPTESEGDLMALLRTEAPVHPEQSKTEPPRVERKQRQITEIRVFYDDGTYEAFKQSR